MKLLRLNASVSPKRSYKYIKLVGRGISCSVSWGKKVYIKENSRGGKSKITYTCTHTRIQYTRTQTHIHNYIHYVIRIGKTNKETKFFFFRMDLYM